jgi:hypothetical protein
MTIKMFQLQTNIVEGLTNNTDMTTPTNSNTFSSSGEAGTSPSYASGIKSQVVKMQDELLISKYRKEYENVLINLDDYVGYLMIKQTLNLKINDDVKTNIEKMNNLNILIPMAGEGSRFKEAGYIFPKPIIEVKGKPMIQLVVENIGYDANYIFIVRKEHYDNYNLNLYIKFIF